MGGEVGAEVEAEGLLGPLTGGDGVVGGPNQPLV